MHIGPSGLRALAHRPQVGVHPHRGRAFGDAPLIAELKLEVGTHRTRRASLIAVRCAKLALDR